MQVRYGTGDAVGIPQKPWGIPAVLAVLALPLLLFVTSFFSEVPEDLSTAEIVAGLLAVIVLKDVLFIGLAAGFALWRYRLGWAELGFRPFDPGLWWLPIAVAFGSLGGVIIYGIILVALGFDAPSQEEIETFFDSRAALPLVALALVIAAPLSEEIFFRGFIFPGLIKGVGLAGAMGVNGVLFGAMHVTGTETLGLLIPFSAIGALFCWLYYRTGSLWPCIIAHGVFNAVGFTANAIASW